MSNEQKIKRLRRALAPKSPLSFDKAYEQLPALVAAEAAGEDVETAFADVLQALDQYPLLAEAYGQLMEEQADFHNQAVPLPMPEKVPTFFPAPPIEVAKNQVLPWGAQVGNLLISLRPKLLSKGPLTPDADDDIEYINHSIQGDSQTIHVKATLRDIGNNAWEVVIAVASTPPAGWRVEASMEDEALPVISRDRDTTRFGPLDDIPMKPILLALQPLGE